MPRQRVNLFYSSTLCALVIALLFGSRPGLLDIPTYPALLWCYELTINLPYRHTRTRCHLAHDCILRDCSLRPCLQYELQSPVPMDVLWPAVADIGQ
jgi:hypothetical protein